MYQPLTSEAAFSSITAGRVGTAGRIPSVPRGMRQASADVYKVSHLLQRFIIDLLAEDCSRDLLITVAGDARAAADFALTRYFTPSPRARSSRMRICLRYASAASRLCRALPPHCQRLQCRTAASQYLVSCMSSFQAPCIAFSSQSRVSF